jgi:AcrR family transcriptional regulator
VARPPDADSAKTYDQILAAALREIDATDPPTGISVRKVAERAGVSLGTLQYYFGKKVDLLEACLDDYHERLREVATTLMQTALASDPPLVGRAFVEPAVRAFHRFARENRGLLHLRLITNVVSGELPERRRTSMLDQKLGSAVKLLAPGVGIPEEDIALTVQIFAIGLSRVALMSDDEREVLMGSTDDEVHEDFLVRMAFRLLQLE